MKALALLSGGLDSILSICLLKKQGIDIEAVCFTSVFFDDRRAKKVSEELEVPLTSIDITRKLLAIIKCPPHGFGKGANPCIDCHILMIKSAGSLMEKKEAKFLISGEVLGERPKSQSRKALKIIDVESGWGDYILRPLTAKNLPPTLPERKGWVNREKLMDIKGRCRKAQLELAENFQIKDFPTPAGGCLLTDPNFSLRVKYLLSTGKLNINEAKLLKLGRHFRINHQARVIVGRCREENFKIERLATPGDLILKVKEYPGPTALFRGNISFELICKAASIVLRYSDAPDKLTEIEYYQIAEGKTNIVKTRRCMEEEIEKLRIEGSI
ncbi:tRNA 4-thiouridine(8) synthase ThiI [Candidatus Aerophobetes bacterium]|nr:tRNA 4-thiouridine(8) synthase ThiI [Candidatus Aerophobetes bacterium]